ncbi:hypothetical protein HG452_000760 [Candidatus Saccharibacteria bacterium]|nr:hypothetical protein [Candidatus Saccharibacteria bacterium]
MLTVKNVRIFHSLLSRGTKLPHRVRLKTENGEFPAVIGFLKQYENYNIRVEGKIAVNEKNPELQRFELNLLNNQDEAQIEVKKNAQN